MQLLSIFQNLELAKFVFVRRTSILIQYFNVAKCVENVVQSTTKILSELRTSLAEAWACCSVCTILGPRP
jgi:hypothetical protein